MNRLEITGKGLLIYQSASLTIRSIQRISREPRGVHFMYFRRVQLNSTDMCKGGYPIRK